VKKVADLAARLGRLAELTNPVARTLRDRVLLPIAGLFSTKRMTGVVLQEPASRLRVIGRPVTNLERASSKHQERKG
jgi:hypothetical protein